MKKVFETIVNDCKSEGITPCEWLTYGIIAPIVMVVVCLLADWMST